MCPSLPVLLLTTCLPDEQDEVLDREMLQCELRTRLSWAFCTYVHHELRLSAVDQYASQRGLMRVDLELPFTHQVGGRERKQMVVFDTGGFNVSLFLVIMSFIHCLDDIDLCIFAIFVLCSWSASPRLAPRATASS
jgi:hypothetical protein